MLMTSEHTPELKFSVTAVMFLVYFSLLFRWFLTLILFLLPVCIPHPVFVFWFVPHTHTHTLPVLATVRACVCVCVFLSLPAAVVCVSQHSDVSVLEFHLERTPLLTSPHPPELTGQSVPPLDFTSSTLSVCYTHVSTNTHLSSGVHVCVCQSSSVSVWRQDCWQ